MTSPRISIIMPLYNRAWCIEACLESIGLGREGAELVIVDDGSTDDSVATVRRTVARLGVTDRVTLIEQQNAGPSAARNRAAQAAAGEWLVFLDSDDLWLPWTLSVVLDVLASASMDVELAFLAGRNFSDPIELADLSQGRTVSILHENFVATVQHNLSSRYGACNAAIRRQIFLDMGGFEPSLRCAEDTDLFLRVPGRVLFIAAPVLAALRRSGHESLTGNAVEVARGYQWMVGHEPTGRYAGDRVLVRSFLAGSCAYSIRAAFAAGHPGLAYRLYFRNIRRLYDARTRKYVLRLPLTPLLHLVRPKAYPFHWSPVSRKAG